MNETDQLEHVIILEGRKKNPIHLNPFVIASHLICCVIGIPINLFIVVVILYMRRLRTKPRNIFLLGLILSNLSAFAPVLVEFAYIHFPRNEELCQFYVSIVGLPYVLFLNNLLLALTDRHIAISHPVWHYKKVTIRRVVCWQVFTSIFISVVYKFAYVSQFLPLKCEVQLFQVRVISITLLMMFTVCVLAQVFVYRSTRKILANYSAIRSKQMIPLVTTNREENIVNQNPASAVNDVVTGNHLAPQPCDQHNVNLFSVPMTSDGDITITTTAPVELNVHMSNETVGHLEIEATRTMIASVTSLSVMTGPFILYTFVAFTCPLWFDKLSCSSMSWLVPYLKELILFHAVYHPIVYLCRSNEVSSALQSYWKKR